MEFVADAAKLAEILERERSHELLFGLKLKFDEVTSCLLRREPAPDLHGTFFAIFGEESRKIVKMGEA